VLFVVLDARWFPAPCGQLIEPHAPLNSRFAFFQVLFGNDSAVKRCNGLQCWQQCLSQVCLESFVTTAAIFSDQMHNPVARATGHVHESFGKSTGKIFVCADAAVASLSAFYSGPALTASTFLGDSVCHLRHRILASSLIRDYPVLRSAQGSIPFVTAMSKTYDDRKRMMHAKPIDWRVAVHESTLRASEFEFCGARMPEIEVTKGYVPGCIGRVAELHGTYYAENWGFGRYFEAKVAT